MEMQWAWAAPEPGLHEPCRHGWSQGRGTGEDNCGSSSLCYKAKLQI